MTREEAINLLADMDSDKYTAKEAVALTMAIKALEQEPCDDAISRYAAIETIINMCKHYTPTKSVYHPHMDFVIEELKELPSVNPQPKMGHWIEVLDEEGFIDGNPVKLYHYECSECGNFGINIGKDKFCCECGARMIAPQERSE